MKVCTKCQVEKNIDEFPYSSKRAGKRRTWCRECCADYQRIYSKSRKRPHVAEQQKVRDEKRRQWLWDYLSQCSCIDCGIDNPIVLHFDHIDRATKTKNVSRLVLGNATMDKVLKEIDKCVIRCANCHALRTAEQFGWYKNQRT